MPNGTAWRGRCPPAVPVPTGRGPPARPPPAGQPAYHGCPSRKPGRTGV